MPKSKRKSRPSKPVSLKLTKDLVTGIAIGAIVIFVICLMMSPK